MTKIGDYLITLSRILPINRSIEVVIHGERTRKKNILIYAQ